MAAGSAALEQAQAHAAVGPAPTDSIARHQRAPLPALCRLGRHHIDTHIPRCILTAPRRQGLRCYNAWRTVTSPLQVLCFMVDSLQHGQHVCPACQHIKDPEHVKTAQEAVSSGCHHTCGAFLTMPSIICAWNRAFVSCGFCTRICLACKHQEQRQQGQLCVCFLHNRRRRTSWGLKNESNSAIACQALPGDAADGIAMATAGTPGAGSAAPVPSSVP